MNLASEFCASVEARPQKTAVFWGDSEWSYARLEAQAGWVAATLQRRFNVEPGQRVGLWVGNCPEFITAVVGVFLSGAVVVPINTFLKPEEVHYILADAGIDVLISDSALHAELGQLSASRPALRTLLVQEFGAEAASRCPPVDRSVDDLAVLIYTSGTTGHPKGAMLTHGNLLHNVTSCRHVLEAAQLDRFALVLPMFHSFMFTVCILLPLHVGGSIVLLKSLHPPRSILHDIIRLQATVLPAIPQLFRALAHAPAPPGLSLRLCISGAAPLPVEILREFGARYPTLPLVEGYGLSEASPVVSINPIHGLQKPGSIGLPVLNVEVTIRDDAGNEVAAGQTGEVCVRGGNVMAGYWNRPEETAQAIRGGWLYTGDIGRRDEDGYFYITDRKKDMLLVNGINVYPREIEEVLYQFPAIKEAAVIGRPDARKGEQPVAYIAIHDAANLDEPALHRFLRGRLADYKVPRHVHQLPALPRNATGKILKTALRQLPF